MADASYRSYGRICKGYSLKIRAGALHHLATRCELYIFPNLEAVTQETPGILCLKSKSGGPEPRSADCRLPAGFGRFGLRKGVQNFGRPVLVWYASALYGSFNVSFDSTGCWLTSSWSSNYMCQDELPEHARFCLSARTQALRAGSLRTGPQRSHILPVDSP